MQSTMMSGYIAIAPVFRIIQKEDKEIHICRSLVAVHRYDYTKKASVADFFQIVCFGSKAEYMAKAFEKGDRISVSGEFRNYNYKDINGTKHFTNYVLVRNLEKNYGNGKKKEEEAAVGLYTQDDMDISFMTSNEFLLISEDMFEREP